MNRALIIQQNPISVERNDTWVLIFHHNSSNKEFFKNEREALFSTKKNKYSLFGRITDEFKISGAFEFIIEYPQINEFYHFSQTKNPIKSNPNDDIGFIPLSKTMRSLTGLAKSSEPKCTFLDGTTNDDDTWSFAIGSYCKWNTERCFPGPYNGNSEFCFNTVNVYMRIDDPRKLEKLLLFNVCTRQAKRRTSPELLFFAT